MGVAKGLKGDRLKLPAMEWGYLNSKPVNAILNGLGNGLVYGIIAESARAIIEKNKKSQN